MTRRLLTSCSRRSASTQHKVNLTHLEPKCLEPKWQTSPRFSKKCRASVELRLYLTFSPWAYGYPPHPALACVSPCGKRVTGKTAQMEQCVVVPGVCAVHWCGFVTFLLLSLGPRLMRAAIPSESGALLTDATMECMLASKQKCCERDECGDLPSQGLTQNRQYRDTVTCLPTH